MDNKGNEKKNRNNEKEKKYSWRKINEHEKELRGVKRTRE